MKKLPIGIQTFSKLIENNYLYIDKTKLIYEIIASGGSYYFLSRPRRFGKSLLISTFKEIFSGNRDLFKGLWIYEKLTWEKHPVVHLDFSIIEHAKEIAEFEKSLSYEMDKVAREYGLVLAEIGLKQKFADLTAKLHEKYGKVVLLIDEYDKPIIDHIENLRKANANKEFLAGFYEVIKNIDNHLQFVFITGVSKFTKVSVFSRLNNLEDITHNKDLATICGYTQTELEENFADYLQLLESEYPLERASLLKKIQKWYNGYNWTGGEQRVYNPFGILNLFKSKTFHNYWFGTATPTFLIKLIKEQKIIIEDFENYKAGEEIFDSFDLEKLDPAALLFQTGYLTIKRIKNRLVTFGYPNFEVKESFLVHLLAAFVDKFASQIKPIYLEMLEYLAAEKLTKFQTAVIALFAGIPSQLHLNHESYYHSLCYLILALLGAEIILEENTDKGRIDAVLELEGLVYLIEFKLAKAQEALQQIKDKRYFEKYLQDSRKLILMGVGGFREKKIEVLWEVM